MPIPPIPAVPNPLSSNFAADALVFTQWMAAAAPQFDAAADIANAGAGDAEAARDAAVIAQGLAQDAVIAAGAQVTLAAAEKAAAQLAKTGAETAHVLAEDARDEAQTYAALAGVAAGLPALAGQAGKWLRVRADASGVEWYVGLDIPAGTVLHVAASSPPVGYLKANGAAVSRAVYAALFAAIGTTYGAGDGSTTFALPDLRGEFVRGWSDGRGDVDPGRALGSAQAAQTQNHNHTGLVTRSPVMQDLGPHWASGSSTVTPSDSSSETRPRNVALLACIKY